MTFDELLRTVLTILPFASIGEDEEGQLIIHTGVAESNPGEVLVPCDEHTFTGPMWGYVDFTRR